MNKKKSLLNHKKFCVFIFTKMTRVKRAIVDEIYRGTRKRFPSRKTKMVRIDNLWQMDLSILDSLSKYNRGYKYLFCIIDTFSRYAFVLPLKTKTGKEITSVFSRLLRQTKRKPQLIHCDLGTEFYNKTFRDFLARKNIHLYSTTTSTKAAIVERFQRTFKTALFTLMAYNGSYNYIDHLQKLVSNYNNKWHRSLGFLKPSAVNKQNEKHLLETVFKEPKIYKPGKCHLHDLVRIADPDGLFDKGYQANFSTAIFYISKVLKTNPPTYRIIDRTSGEELVTLFYEPQLERPNMVTHSLLKGCLKRQKVDFTSNGLALTSLNGLMLEI